MSLADSKINREVLVPVILFTVLLGGAAWWSWSMMQQAETAERRLNVRLREWRALQATSPAPVQAVADRLAAAVDSAQARAQEIKRDLGVGRSDEVASAEPPTQRAEAFFQITQFVEAQREQARSAGVAIADNAHFGFGAFSNSGPPEEHLGVVHRQRLLVEQLLAALWPCAPRELTRVQRERAETKVAASDETRAASRVRNDEDLPWPAERSLQRKDLVDTLAVRIGFVGTTGTLRHFLQRLRALELPLVVREVEVLPLGADGRASGGARTLADLFRDQEEGVDNEEEAVALIAVNEAEFSVAVEYLDFAGPQQRLATAGEESW